MQCIHEETKKEVATFRKRNGEIVSVEIILCEICKRKVSEGEELQIKKIYI